MVQAERPPESSPHVDVPRTIKEPDSLMDFPKKTGLKVSKIPKNRTWTKQKDEFGIRDKLAGTDESLIMALKEIEEKVLKGGDGSGVHFFMPMTKMAHFGDFLMGALKVIAPKARVTLLPTPNFKGFAHHGDAKKQKLDQILDRNVKASLRDTDETFVIIDDMPQEYRGDGGWMGDIRAYNYTGTTVDEVTKHLPKPPILLNWLNWGTYEDKRGLDKHHEGRFWLRGGYLMDFFEKHPEYLDRHTPLKEDAYGLISYLSEYPKHYLTEEEIQRMPGYWSNMEDYARYVRGMPDEARIRKIYSEEGNWEHTRANRMKRKAELEAEFPGFSAQRRKEIIKKLKRDDAILRKGLFMYGVAAAKDYLRKHGGQRLEKNALDCAKEIWDGRARQIKDDEGRPIEGALLRPAEVSDISDGRRPNQVSPEEVLDYLRMMDDKRKANLIRFLHRLNEMPQHKLTQVGLYLLPE